MQLNAIFCRFIYVKYNIFKDMKFYEKIYIYIIYIYINKEKKNYFYNALKYI